MKELVHKRGRLILLGIKDMFCYIQCKIHRRGRLFAKDVLCQGIQKRVIE